MDRSSERAFTGALRWALIQSGGRRGISLLVSFVLAAMVGPEAFGVVALAMAYLSFLQIFVSEGMSMAVVQRKELLDDHKQAVFWLNLAASIGLAGVSIALSGWWARLNHTPGLEAVVVALSLILPIDGLSVVHRGLLQRRMSFRKLAIRDGLSVLIGGVVGISTALLGWGVWSLVAQRLVVATTGSVVLWWSSRWRPRPRFSWGRAKEMVGFASGIYAASAGRYLSNYLDTLVLGVFFGPMIVGLYHIADTFRAMIGTITNQAVASVSLPHMSRSQDDIVELRRRFLHSIRSSTLLAVPLLSAMAVCSDLILGLVGPNWQPAAPAMRILCILGIMVSCVQMRGPLLMALGRPHLLMWIVWTQGVVVGLSLVLAAGMLRDASSVDATITVSGIRTAVFAAVVMPATFWIAQRVAGITVAQLARAISPSLVLGAIVVGVGHVVLGLLGMTPSAVVGGVTRMKVLVSLGVVGLSLLPIFAVSALVVIRGVQLRELLGLWRISGLRQRMKKRR